jgi:hypothetical protein
MHKHQTPNLKAQIRSALYLVSAVLACLCATLYAHNVSQKITPEDVIYIEKILNQAQTNARRLEKTAETPFPDEIRIIRAIQRSAFTTAPNVQQIPLGQPREPKDLFATKAAYCGDRARYIDKALRHYGFTTRYASLYEKQAGISFLKTILTKGDANNSESHALVEVLTSKGWLIIDTRRQWISLTTAQQPITLEDLKDKPLAYFQWDRGNKQGGWPLLDRHYYIIYDLYSRHGQFYAPYTKYVPDVYWLGFIKNNLFK